MCFCPKAQDSLPIDSPYKLFKCCTLLSKTRERSFSSAFLPGLNNRWQQRVSDSILYCGQRKQQSWVSGRQLLMYKKLVYSEGLLTVCSDAVMLYFAFSVCSVLCFCITDITWFPASKKSVFKLFLCITRSSFLIQPALLLCGVEWPLHHYEAVKSINSGITLFSDSIFMLIILTKSMHGNYGIPLA